MKNCAHNSIKNWKKIYSELDDFQKNLLYFCYNPEEDMVIEYYPENININFFEVEDEINYFVWYHNKNYIKLTENIPYNNLFIDCKKRIS